MGAIEPGPELRSAHKWRRATIVLATAAAIFFAAVVAQAAMLYGQGWRLSWGTVPDWLIVFGSAAAFVGIGIAWRTYTDQVEARRDEERRRFVGELVAPLSVLMDATMAPIDPPFSPIGYQPDQIEEYRRTLARTADDLAGIEQRWVSERQSMLRIGLSHPSIEIRTTAMNIWADFGPLVERVKATIPIYSQMMDVLVAAQAIEASGETDAEKFEALITERLGKTSEQITRFAESAEHLQLQEDWTAFQHRVGDLVAMTDPIVERTADGADRPQIVRSWFRRLARVAASWWH